jgi:hypothetical protein
MHSHNDKLPEGHKPEEVDASQGYEQTDIGVKGIVVFLVGLACLVAVTGILCYGIGSAINGKLDRDDGPNSKWVKSEDASIRQLGNLPTSPELQGKVHELTQSFPTPRVQLDDGNEDVMELHEREDLLLNNYSWVDQSRGTVRIPIERAMELVAEQGRIKVAAPAQHAPLMAGDSEPKVIAPLTNGFARTAYEQVQARVAAVQTARPEAK